MEHAAVRPVAADPRRHRQVVSRAGHRLPGVAAHPDHGERCAGVRAYKPAPDGGLAPWSIQVLELRDGRVAGITFFLDTERFFPLFGCPITSTPEAGAHGRTSPSPASPRSSRSSVDGSRRLTAQPIRRARSASRASASTVAMSASARRARSHRINVASPWTMPGSMCSMRSATSSGSSEIDDEDDRLRLLGHARVCHRPATSFTHQTRSRSGTHRRRRQPPMIRGRSTGQTHGTTSPWPPEGRGVVLCSKRQHPSPSRTCVPRSAAG